MPSIRKHPRLRGGRYPTHVRIRKDITRNNGVKHLSNIVVSFKAEIDQRTMLENIFKRHNLTFLNDYEDGSERNHKLDEAQILIAWNPTNELSDISRDHLRKIEFMQLLSAGYDHVRFDMFSTACKVAANQGAYALPMAEHVLAMILDRAKRLEEYHRKLAEGIFEQSRSVTKQVTGSTLGIIGFGSIGKETARLMRPFEPRILALNTTGKTDEDVDFCGTLSDLEAVLSKSDWVVLSLPLNERTDGLIGRRELSMMKKDAVLVNVARGAIVKEKDLYEHLKSTPEFSACIDAWWVEPFRQGEFRLDFPFFELPNVLGSPHNSALVEGIMLRGATRAAENVVRYLNGELPGGIVPRPVSTTD